jgi:hypothetical protein
MANYIFHVPEFKILSIPLGIYKLKMLQVGLLIQTL